MNALMWRRSRSPSRSGPFTCEGLNHLIARQASGPRLLQAGQDRLERAETLREHSELEYELKETGKKQALPDLLSEVLTTHNDPDAVIAEMRTAGRSADLAF